MLLGDLPDVFHSLRGNETAALREWLEPPLHRESDTLQKTAVRDVAERVTLHQIPPAFPVAAAVNPAMASPTPAC